MCCKFGRGGEGVRWENGEGQEPMTELSSIVVKGARGLGCLAEKEKTTERH